MHLIGEASRLIAVEINLESNSHHKQNYILLYQDESEQQCLLYRCPLSAAAMWAERRNPICYKLSINLGWVLKCLDEKFISVSKSCTFNEKCRRAKKFKKTPFFLCLQVVKTRNENVRNKSVTCYKGLTSRNYSGC